MNKKTLGQELVTAVKEALESKEQGRVVRPNVNVIEIRRGLHMTQREFSKQYHIRLQTLRNWEQRKRVPDTTSLAYLACIARRPKQISNILKSCFG